MNWNPEIDKEVNTIYFADGVVYISGFFTQVNGQPRKYIAAINSTTGSVEDWFPDLDMPINAFAFSDNILYAAGSFTQINGQTRKYLAAFNTFNGELTDWHPEADSRVSTILLHGKTIFAGGSFRKINGLERNYIASINTINGEVNDWNPNANNEVLTLGQKDGLIYAGGAFTSMGGINRNYLACIDTVTGRVTNWNPSPDYHVYSLALVSDTLYVGGRFRKLGGQSRCKLAAVFASTGEVLNWTLNANSDIYTLSVSGKNLFVGGDFSSIGGQERSNLASVDAITGQATSWSPSSNAEVNTMVLSKNTIYIGGVFTELNGEVRNHLAAVNATTGQITAWNPNIDRSSNDPYTAVYTLSLADNTLYVGGYFTGIGEQIRNRLAAVDATTGQVMPWNPNVTGPYDLAFCAINSMSLLNNTLYVGGIFTGVGGQARIGAAAVNAITGQLMDWNPEVNGYINSLIANNNTVYLGGSFSKIGSHNQNYLAAVDATSGQAKTWDLNPNEQVHSLALSGSTLYVGGNFTEIGEQSRNRLAMFDITSGHLSSWEPNVYNIVKTIVPTDNTIYVGGYFDYVNHKRVFGFAAFGKSSIRRNRISGYVYEDLNGNCKQDPEEKGISNTVIVSQPGLFFASTDSLGHYTLAVDSGSYTLKQVLPTSQYNYIQQLCPISPAEHKVHFTSSDEIITGKDFANRIIRQPYLTVNVSSLRHRRCFPGTTTISYRNQGNAGADSVNVYLKLPEYVRLKSANVAYRQDKELNYVFCVGKLAADHSGTIIIQDSVICGNSSIRGLTQCTKVWITPSNLNTPSATWDHSDVELKARCQDNGFVRLGIYNTGQGSMADSSAFRILLDAQLAFQGNYQLSKGDSLILRVPANGRTVRLEADQRPGHPSKQQSTVTVEACGSNQNGTVSTGYVAQLPPDDEEPEVDIECLQIIDSFDPNDKLVSPQGVTAEKYTPTQAELDYVIRFQNTGTDVAYRVVVVDTLTEHLEISTLQVRGASHPYQFNISGKGQPVLTWTFDNIQLPDSTTDQLGSNGFVHFSIRPKRDLPEKTRIENFADIFFDYNEPVRTNTTLNTIYDVPPTVVDAVRLEAKVVYNQPTITGLEPSVATEWKIYPSPHSGQFTVEVPSQMGKVTQLVILDAMGRPVYDHLLSHSSRHEINLSGYLSGIYFVKVQTERGTFVKRMMKQ